jgi:hypothetical protein
MDQATINRYQPGGDIYAQMVKNYGASNANAIASAALSGDETQVNAAIDTAQFGAPLDSSTTDQFVNLIETDPLGAPLADLNTTLGNTFLSFLKNPWVLLTGGFLAFVFLFDGINVVRGLLKRRN